MERSDRDRTTSTMNNPLKGRKTTRSMIVEKMPKLFVLLASKWGERQAN